MEINEDYLFMEIVRFPKVLRLEIYKLGTNFQVTLSIKSLSVDLKGAKGGDSSTHTKVDLEDRVQDLIKVTPKNL